MMRSRGTRNSQVKTAGAQRVPIEEFRREHQQRALGQGSVPFGGQRQAEVRQAIAAAKAADPSSLEAAIADATAFPVAKPFAQVTVREKELADETKDADTGVTTDDPYPPTCIICQHAMSHDVPRPDLPRELPCGHVFHGACLGAWLMRSCTCPLCRRDLQMDITKLTSRREQCRRYGCIVS